MARREKIFSVLVVFCFLLLFGQAVRKGFAPGMPAFGDAWPFPPTTEEALRTFGLSWDFRNPGLDMPAVTVISFLTVFEGLFGFLLGGNMVWAARLFYFYLPLPLMFVSMYWFLGKIGLGRFPKFVAAFVYAANFFTIGELLGGYPGTNYVQVLFPLILFSLYKRRFLPFSLLFALAYIFSDHVIILILPFFFVFILSGFYRNRWWGLVEALLFIFWSAVAVILLTLPYTYFYLGTSLPFLGGTPLQEEVLAFLVRNVNDTYRYFTLGDSLRLGGSSFLSLYGLSNFTVRVGFIIPLLAFSWFIFPVNRCGRRLKIGILFTLLAVVAITFIYDAHRSEAIPLFRWFPFLFRFRNPSRPTLFLSLCYAPLIALTLDGFIGVLSSRLTGKVRLVVLGLVVVLIGLPLSYYLRPFFSGDYTFSRNRGQDYTIAARYDVLGRWLVERRSAEGSFRTLWLPYNHEEVEMKIRYIDPFAYAVPINYGAYMDNEYLDWMKRVYLKMSLGDYSVLDDLARAGVKYIVLNDLSQDGGAARFEYDYLTPWLPGEAQDWRKKVLAIPGTKEMTNLAGFTVYENQRYTFEKVNPLLAGYLPESAKERLWVKNLTIWVAGLTWLLALAGVVRFSGIKKPSFQR